MSVSSTSDAPATSKRRRQESDLSDDGQTNGNGLAAAPSAAAKAMNNPLVMAKIAETMGPDTLLELRATCRAWNYVILPWLGARHRPVGLFRPAALEEGDESMDRVQEYMDCMNRSPLQGPTPFTRFRMDVSAMTVSTPFVDFLVDFGPTVTSLSLQWSRQMDGASGSGVSLSLSLAELRGLIFKRLPVLRELSLEPPAMVTTATDTLQDGPATIASTDPLVAQLPKLRRLKFAPVALSDWGGVGLTASFPPYGQVVMDVIRNAPELECLSLGLGCLKAETSLALLSVMKDRLQRPGPSPSRLTTLKLSGLGSPQLGVLLEMAVDQGLRLSSFHGDIVCNMSHSLRQRSEVAELLHIFLDTQSATLLKLKLAFQFCSVGHRYRLNSARGRGPNFGVQVRIPPMERLHTLKLVRSEQMRLDLRYEHPRGGRRRLVQLADICPLLRRFGYRHGELSHNSDVNLVEDAKRFRHDGVTALELECCTENLEKFAPRLRSVTRLRVALLHVSSWWTARVPTIWQMWAALTKLDIRITSEDTDVDLDEFLTGVPRGRAPALAREIELLPRSLDRDALIGLARKYKTDAGGLSDLAQLTEFSLFREEWECQVTDISGYLAFACSGQELRRVSIRGHKLRCLISEECTAAIETAGKSFVCRPGNAPP